jgi:long-chain acyl-CoA synthetase
MYTIAGLLLERANSSPDLPALQVKRQGAYDTLTWADVAHDVRRCALGLLRLGVRCGDRVAQLAENRYEWLLCDLAIQCVGAVHVPIHASLAGPQVLYQLRHSEASILILSGVDQAAKVSIGPDPLPVDLRCLSFDPCTPTQSNLTIQRLDGCLPSDVDDSDARRLDELATTGVSPDCVATILYTSGTTGRPRGVALSHRNLLFNATSMVNSSKQWESDVKLNFLPLSHIYARTCDFYTWIVAGNRLALAESRDTVLSDCAAVRPTWINAVPYFYDKVRRQLEPAGDSRHPIDLRTVFGDRIRILHSGGAPVSTATSDFYEDHGLPLYEGYGLTEASPVITTSHPGQIKRGTVGKPLHDVEVRIAEDGEILTRGRHVMVGYWRDAEATDEAVRGGWLHTGDIGYLDEHDFLTITGRKKEIIVTTGGKNIAPAAVEACLAEDPLIQQVIVVGDGRNYLAALIVPDRDELSAELGRRGLDRGLTTPSLTDQPVIELFEHCIAARLAGLSHYEQVRQFKLLEKPFTVESGELTLKRSLRREVILARYAREIDSLY